MNFAQKLIYFIDQYGKLFEFIETRRANWFEQTFEVKSWLNNTSKVLDIGSGVGDVTKILTKYSDNIVYGIDVEDFRRKGNKKQSPIQFVIGDANYLPFPDNSFDLVTIFWTLHHISNPIEILHEVHRVGTPNAQVIILEDLIDKERSFQGRFTRIYDSVINLEISKHPHSNLSLDGWKKLINNNFNIFFLELNEIPWFTPWNLLKFGLIRYTIIK